RRDPGGPQGHRARTLRSLSRRSLLASLLFHRRIMVSPRRGLPAAAALLAGLLAAGCREPARPPHLVLVSADALRADHLSGSGYGRATSPTLARFAAAAWDFTDAVTVLPKTGPAFATIFSGLHPERHGVTANRYRIPPDVPLLAEQLRRHGYLTAAFVTNPE